MAEGAPVIPTGALDRRGTWRTFGLADGLAGVRAEHIAEDGRGDLWFATLSGVCWYDGRRFHHPGGEGTANRPVQFLFEDGQSRLWCAGTGTLGHFQDDEYHDLVPRYVERYGGLRRRLAARPRARGWPTCSFAITTSGAGCPPGRGIPGRTRTGATLPANRCSRTA